MLTLVYRGRGGLRPLLAAIALTAISLLATPPLALAPLSQSWERPMVSRFWKQREPGRHRQGLLRRRNP
jgi:hypothetical protein